jgi:hypothetical protein
MPIFAFIFGVSLGKFTKEYITHKHQIKHLDRINSVTPPGAYLEWLTKS